MDCIITRRKKQRVCGSNRKPVQVRIQRRRIENIYPAPENEVLYRPITADDPEIQSLTKSVKEKGILEPLIVTADGYVVSGNRRLVAARLSGLATVPCRVLKLRRSDNPDRFVELLREHNRQRIKSNDELMREAVVDVNPDLAYLELLDYRRSQNHLDHDLEVIDLRGHKGRHKISKAKEPFLRAAIKVIDDLKIFWPLSVRLVHYKLLNNPPLRHTKKPDSVYDNTLHSYRDLDDLLVRARLFRRVPMSAIDDETRPCETWPVDRSTQPFITQSLNNFLRNYWRDLLQSQPAHIEVVCEKMSMASVIKAVCMEFVIPYTIGRGYCCLPRRAQMVERFKKSGKDKLIVLMLSDHDPDGKVIASSFARTLRDDFGITNIEPIQAALTFEQVESLNLPPQMKAKKDSPNYKKFIKEHGRNVFELEAVNPTDMQNILQGAIEQVLDLDAFYHEREAEKKDNAFLAGVRKNVCNMLKDLPTPDDDGGGSDD